MISEELKKILENKAEEEFGEQTKKDKLVIKHNKELETFKDIENWKKKKGSKIVKSNQITIYENHIKLILNSNINSLVCVSQTGLGKTYATLNILRKNKKDYAYKNGFTTALSLYQYIYKHKTDLIIIDDLTDNIFKDKKIIAILKACLYGESNKRFVNYQTTSDKLEVPSNFEFTGKLIILANEIGNKNSEDFKALISRGIFYELIYSYEEVISIANKIIKDTDINEKEKKLVKNIMKRNVTNICEFNFRKLEQLIEMVKFDIHTAEELFINSYKIDEDNKIVFRLMQKPISIKEQAQMFMELTGKSRATYFRIKKSIKVSSKTNVRLSGDEE